ncbi:MAG: hypothetical protein JF595_12600 [Sphingomonadales bacterium]|nr:hypothetical protein [Sphingomonadales bacterium]
MKPIIAAGLATAIMLTTPALAGVNARQAHQQHRIMQGVHSGALTQREANRLERQQYHVARSEARLRASGGRLTAHERARLQHEQNRASVNIYAQKHDRQVR